GLGESGRDLSALGQIAQNAEVLFVNVDAKHDKLLLRKFRTKSGGERASQIEQRLLVHSGTAYPGQYADTARLENTAAFCNRMMVDEIVDSVVTLIAVCELFFLL